MYYPGLREFLYLAKKGTVIPVYKEINADLDTPVSAFLKIRKGNYAFLLESVEGQEKIARYSFLGSSPSLVFRSMGRSIHLEYPCSNRPVRKFFSSGSPLDEIKKLMRDFTSVQIKGLPRFCGGLVGYVGYDMVRFFEEIPDKNPDELGLADAVFMLADTILVFDHVNHTIKIVSNVMLPDRRLSAALKEKLYREAIKKIEGIHRQLGRPIGRTEPSSPPSRRMPRVSSNLGRKEFARIVEKAKAYIRKGDIIQVVLSQRFSAPITKTPFDIYRSLRSLNPSPYMFFLQFGEASLVGASPEKLVRCEDGLVQTMPIAGTRPRGKDDVDDARLEQELLGDAKSGRNT